MSALTLPESLTQSNALSALVTLSAGLKNAPSPVQLNASMLRRFDSVALACLLEICRQVNSQGKSLSIHGLPQGLKDLAQLYGLAEILDMGQQAHGN